MWELLIFLAIGGVAGWLASQLMKGRGMGVVANVVVGVVGSFLGKLAFGLLGLRSTHLIGEILTATVGAALFLWVMSRIRD